jgi:predicted nucleic acid-binding Zn ribbon protein
MRCPHCGEPVDSKQERCFACGQRIFARGMRRDRPFDPRVLIFACAALLVVVVGLVIALAPKSRSRPDRTKSHRRAESDSARRAARDTVRTTGDNSRADRVLARLDKVRQRYENICRENVSGSPTAEQSRLMGQIEARLQNVRSLAMALASSNTRAGQDSLEDRISRAERELSTMVSQFSRAPRNR